MPGLGLLIPVGLIEGFMDNRWYGKIIFSVRMTRNFSKLLYLSPLIRLCIEAGSQQTWAQLCIHAFIPMSLYQISVSERGPWCRMSYPTLAREFQGFRVWGKFVFRTLELTDTPTNLANQVKVGHALDQSRSVQSRGPERAHQNNEPSWQSSRRDRRVSRQLWVD